jgi:membrane associated rhomboid family serine protease
MSIIDEIKASFRKSSYYIKIIYINVGVFALLYVADIFYPVSQYFAVPGDLHILLYRPWTILTYMFVHAGFMHILFNMLWLFWFGGIFMNYLSNKQLLAVYLLGGFMGAFFHLATNYFLPEYARAGVVGASAAVMTIVFAISAYKPDYAINLVFIGPVKIKYIALISFFIDITGVLSDMKQIGGGSGVAHFAHLGGAFYGLWWGYKMREGKDINRRFGNLLDKIFSLFKSTSGNQMKIAYRNPTVKIPKDDKEYNKTKADTIKEMDRILDKISKSGYDSLTSQEKEFLFKQKK